MESLVTQFIIGYVACYMSPIYIMYFIGFFMRWQYYHILEDRETMNSILKKLKSEVVNTTVYSVQNRTVLGGYFISFKCVGMVEISYETPKVFIFCTHAFYENLKDMPAVSISEFIKPKLKESLAQKNVNTKIDVYVRKGTYKNFYYNKLKFDLSHITPLGDQETILKDIIQIYETVGRATVFVEGVSNAGKSTLGFLLAKELEGAYCHTFNPTDPGDHLMTLTMEHMFDDGPLILVLEEVDEMLKKLHQGFTPQSKEIPTLVHNKSTWSSFLDDMLFYKKVILILTSNTSKKELDSLDVAYLREGRVHANYSMPSLLQKI